MLPQLHVSDGLLWRSVKVPPNEEVTVPVIPSSLVSAVVSDAHCKTGHAGWEAVYQLLRSRCFFAHMRVTCQRYVSECGQCRAANPAGDPPVPRTRPVIPNEPRNVVQMDTLELSVSSSSGYHCVLVCFDTFSRWAEVVPLRNHDAKSVAEAFVQVCTKWGPPAVIRCDNSTEFTEFVSATVQAVEVVVKHGAVRHPESQGAAERFNRTLLTLIRKVLAESDGWMSRTAEQIEEEAARIQDYIEEEMSAADRACARVVRPEIQNWRQCHVPPVRESTKAEATIPAWLDCSEDRITVDCGYPTLSAWCGKTG